MLARHDASAYSRYVQNLEAEALNGRVARNAERSC